MFLEGENRNKFKIKNYNKQTVSKEFIDEIKRVEKLYIAHEDYGNTVEFYDEDGIVVLSIDIQSASDEDCLLFKFPLSDKEFKISEEDFNFEVDENE